VRQNPVDIPTALIIDPIYIILMFKMIFKNKNMTKVEDKGMRTKEENWMMKYSLEN
jgi:hypothetical protein